MSTSPDRSAPTGTAAAVPLVDIRRQFEPLAEAMVAALARVARSGQYVLGPDCQQLETALAKHCGAAHAVGCASGSDALLLALMACGVGPGDEVIAPSYTFFATASAAWRLGARPVFVDIDPQSYLIDTGQIAARLSSRTKAILPVHLYGQCADMGAISALAQRHGLWVVEDAAQAVGAEYLGRRAGSLGDVGCISFYPTKNLGGMGDGGLLTTNRADLARSLRLLTTHGMEPRYHHQVVGINSRLDTLQAAVLNVKLPHLEHWTETRGRQAAGYQQLFTDWGLDRVLSLPSVLPGRRHVWNQYVVRVPDGRRDALREHLRGQQIGTEVYYPVPLHEQVCFRELGYGAGSLPETERAARETLALPIFPELTGAEQLQVVREIGNFFGVSPTSNRTLSGPKFLKHGAPSAAPSPRAS